ncbi:AAA family ATPase [Mycobacterium sp. MAA66]|uniref:helix-turn-helix transcriptional regulator n=1 Tax=Mycobacterium sp. MAA66 TaxID=3156297 RepID=UPI00351888D5
MGRRVECERLSQLIEAVRAGQSRALVLTGDAGIGKTALLHYVAEQAAECQVLRAAGVQSEMELAFAALHQLCAPILGSLDRLPGPQGDALRTVFGISPGGPPDKFLIGLAVLNLLSDAARGRPLVCVVDDEQWLDRASAQVLGFVARRLVAESVGVVVAARSPSHDLAEVPELEVEGLGTDDARALLDSGLTRQLDSHARDLIVTEARGNPLALLELSRGLRPGALAGGFGILGAVQLSERVEGSFRRRIEVLPDQTRLLLLVAAADPVGDPDLVWRAAARLGIDREGAAAAHDAGVIEFSTRVRFRHPLVRSAVYALASLEDRQRVHAELAEVTDPEQDPDRRAWHRACGAPGPDEDIAVELECSAGRAQGRGGVAAAAAFLERAAKLTLDPARRGDRALAAASAKVKAGEFIAAQELLCLAGAGPLNDVQQARVDLIGADLAFVASRCSDAPALLLKAARRLEPIDAALSRTTYLQALSASMFAGRSALDGGVLEVAQAAHAAPPGPGCAVDLLLDGLVAHYNSGYRAGLPILRQALEHFGTGMSADEELRWHWVAGVVARHLWDDHAWQLLSDRHVELARRVGALSELPLALNSRAFMLLFAGELAAASSVSQELQAVMEATGSKVAPYAVLGVAAMSGSDAQTAALVETTIGEASIRGEGIGISIAGWASAVVNNGIGNYPAAMTAAERALEYPYELNAPRWAAVELVEAATRNERRDTAAEALRYLADITSVSGTDWALGIEARSRALLSDGDPAERLYRESIERLSRTRLRAELARAHLLYGEWLRRKHRRVDARAQLRTAHDMLEAMGMAGFAERARRELRATGETARKRAVAATAHELTPQEAQIAAMARDGLSNPEIGARLFISAHTVRYHLHKVFAKLGVESRGKLGSALSQRATDRLD